MKLENNQNIQYPSPSTLWNCNPCSNSSLSDLNQITIPKTSTISGQYWKSNYYVFLQSKNHGLASHYQLQDSIQSQLLRQHKSVILSTLFDLYKTLQISNHNPTQKQTNPYKICEYELQGNFIEILISMQQFNSWQAKQFINLLKTRFDCKNIYFTFIPKIIQIMHPIFTFLFYFSIKIANSISNQIKKQLNILQNDFENYFYSNLILLKLKLKNLPQMPSLEINLKKITYSIVMALCGIFINKFYNPKLTSNLQFSIPQQQTHKKIKIIDSNRKRIRSFSTPHLQACKKIKF